MLKEDEANEAGRPKVGEIYKIEIEIKESKEIKVSFKIIIFYLRIYSE
jgi:hypothetical protein